MDNDAETQEQAGDSPDYKYAVNESFIVAVTDHNGIITAANDAFCRISKYSPEEITGRDHSIVNSGHHTKAFISDLWSAIKAGKTWKGKIKNKAKDGTYYWVSSVITPIVTPGEATKYIAISSNITDQDVEEELARAQLYLRSSIESYKDVLIFSVDTALNYVFFNSAFKAATNYAYGTEVKKGMSLLESITNSADKAKARFNCDKALAGEAHTTLEVYGDLNLIYFETKYNPIVNQRNEIIGVTVLSANVTERKQAEEQILSLNRELEAFSYSVAHDLRAPLRSVNGYAQILKEDYETMLDAEGQQIIEVIRTSAKKMGVLIDDLLAFSRLGRKEIQKTKIDLDQLVREVIAEINKSMPHRAQIKVAGRLGQVAGDYGLLQQVMFNLVSNAVKYSSKKEQPLVQITSEEKDNETIVSVKDNGAGFDMKYYDKLFGIFQRLHTQHEFDGTGVGLAIIQRIINKHGGKVWAKAKLNEGAVFSFKLPAMEL